MELITDITGPIVPFLIILTILVFVHELGHYVVARICRVRVEVFSIGFGPELMGWTNKRSGTRWKFSLIPLGGYVKMFGDLNAASMPDSSMELAEEEKAYAFPYKTLAQRSWIVAAVPLAGPGFGSPCLRPTPGQARFLPSKLGGWHVRLWTCQFRR